MKKLILVSFIFLLSGCASGLVFEAYYTAPLTVGIKLSSNTVTQTTQVQPATQGANNANSR